MSQPTRVNPYLIVLAVVLTMSGTLALPASASFDHHFRVIDKVISIHRISAEVERLRFALIDPRHPHQRVGRYRGRCKQIAQRKFRCRLVVHLNGDIGGFGKLQVRGVNGGDDRTLEIVGGNHDFRGVTGEWTLVLVGRRTYYDRVDLTR